MKILYEDEDIIVCIKPVGVLSEESADKCSMVTVLKEHTKGDIYPVHRLDKGVSGVMVYAKNKNSAAYLSNQIAQKLFIKEYLAVIHGFLVQEKGDMEDLLFKDSSKNKSFVVKRERKGVKKAKLSYEVVSQRNYENEDISLVKVKLHTGRSHQIRVQFASRQHSLLGDRRYGSKDSETQIALWSYRLSFTHPKTHKKLSFEEMPDEKKDIFALFEE